MIWQDHDQYRGDALVADRNADKKNTVPAVIGPYSPAIRVGNLLFTSGQLPLDPASGSITNRDIGSQTHRAMQNLSAVLEANGTGLEHVIKVTVFLKDLSTFARMNESYRSFFKGTFPARSCVQVAGLPNDADIEVEAVAYVPDRDSGRE